MAKRDAESRAESIPDASLQRHHEIRDWNPRVIAATGAILLVVGALIFLAVWGMLGILAGSQTQIEAQLPRVAVTPIAPPGPDLQVAPARDMEQLLAQENQILHTYGWVDRDAGVVRIPIERAMEIIAERGLPARDAKVPDFGLASGYQLDSEGGAEVGAAEDGG
jgi:hypothetical protein